MKEEIYHVICQKWERCYAGRNGSNDGYSLHLSDEDHRSFLDAYWNAQNRPDVNGWFSRTDGSPYVCQVSPDVYESIKLSKDGIRLFDNPLPVWGEAPRKERHVFYLCPKGHIGEWTLTRNWENAANGYYGNPKPCFCGEDLIRRYGAVYINEGLWAPTRFEFLQIGGNDVLVPVFDR